jgi:3-dehydroquinate dehydratase/shikimate dehydrogenase
MPSPANKEPHTHIAVPLVSNDPPLLEQIAAARMAGADLIELRVDLIDDQEAIEVALAAKLDIPLILTVRSQAEGGAWDRGDDERVALIEHLGLHLPGYVDIEHATWQRSANLRQKIGLVCETQSGEPIDRPRNQLLISHHNFLHTPDNLEPIFSALADTPAAVIKAVFMPQDATDSIRILDALRKWSAQRSTIALGMGEAGLMTRVLAGKFGAWLTFASLSTERESAPGQPTLTALRELYRWNQINPATRVMGVIGWPVGHSKSPALHNAAMAAANVNGVYLLMPVSPSPAAFNQFMETVAEADWLDLAGMSVTLPHKVHARNWLLSRGAPLSNAAQRTGAVNTLIRAANGQWSGDNTDVDGIIAALRTAPSLSQSDWSGKTILILGAGGVARAIIVAAQSRGASVTLTNRSPGKAEALADELNCQTLPWESREHAPCDVLINGTRVGMSPDTEHSPLNPACLSTDTVVFDTVYAPRMTALLCGAQSQGCQIVTGEHMFLAQAERQFELWHGFAPPVDVMRTAFLGA